MEQLAKTDDIRCVGWLIDALWNDERCRDVAVSTLIRLLPRMTKEEIKLLNSRQREHLYSMLTTNDAGDNQSQLTNATLQAIKNIGDATACKYLRRLIKSTSNEQLRHNAQECLAQVKALKI